MAGANSKQIGVDEKQGSGLLITVEPAAATPTAEQYVKVVRNVLSTRDKATIARHLDIDPQTTLPDHTGRPVYLLDDPTPIKELV